MSTGKRRGFLGGAAILAGAVAITKLIGAVYKIPLGNLLGKEGMGPFQAAYNVYSVLLTVSTVGLPLALSRLVAEADALGRVNQRRRIFRVALGLFFVLGLIGGGLMAPAAGRARGAAAQRPRGAGHPSAGTVALLRVPALGHPRLYAGAGADAADGGEPDHRVVEQAHRGSLARVGADAADAGPAGDGGGRGDSRCVGRFASLAADADGLDAAQRAQRHGHGRPRRAALHPAAVAGDRHPRNARLGGHEPCDAARSVRVDGRAAAQSRVERGGRKRPLRRVFLRADALCPGRRRLSTP